MKKQRVVLMVVIMLVLHLMIPGFATDDSENGINKFLSKSISSYGDFTLALKSDGTVWSWGVNSYGQLGDSTVNNNATPKQIATISGIVKVKAAQDHAMALKSDGTVWVWGRNYTGQLGNGNTNSLYTPTKLNSVTDIVDVFTGNESSFALQSDGTVWAWGSNGSGQLGDNTSSNRTAPVKVVNMTNVVDIQGGKDHTVALKSDGTVWTWGYNGNGQLGTGNNVSRTAPGVVPGLNDVVQIASGDHHVLAVKSDGTVWGWGYNQHYQLGINSIGNKTSPYQIGALSNVKMVSASMYHGLALKSDGTVWGWGYNAQSQLGDNTTNTAMVPKQIAGLSNIAYIDAAAQSSLAVEETGNIYYFGANNYGQYGLGNTTTYRTPQKSLFNLGFMKPEFSIASYEALKYVTTTEGLLGFEVKGNLKSLNNSKNYMKLSIKTQDGKLIRSQTLNIKNESGTDLKGNYVISNTAGIDITSKPIDITDLENGKYHFVYTVENEYGINSNEVVQDLRVARSVNVTNSYVKLETFDVTPGIDFVEVTALATDALYGLSSDPYKYTLYYESGEEVTIYSAQGATETEPGKFRQEMLSANTKYILKLEVKNGDSKTATFLKEIYTLSDQTTLSIANAEDVEGTSAKITYANKNPFNTEYRFFVDGQYVNLNGYITDAKEGGWYTTNGVKSFVIKGLDPAKEYTITCDSVNKSGAVMTKSAPLKVTTKSILPEKPVIKSYDEYGDRIKVYWDKTLYATSYEVIVNGISVGKTTALNYEFMKSSAAETYTVAVRALNAATSDGNQVESVPYTIRKRSPLPSALALSTQLYSNSVDISWNAEPSAYGYELYVDGRILKMGKSTKYTHTNIRSTTQHVYKVRAFNGAGFGSWSPITYVLTTNAVPAQLEDVTEEVSDSEIRIKWKPSNNVTSCDVTIAETALAAATDDVSKAKVAATTFYDVKDNFVAKGNLKTSTEYSYTIRVKNENGNAPDLVTGKVSTKALPTPINLKVAESSNKIELTWDTVDNATGYKVTRDGQVYTTPVTETTFSDMNPVNLKQHNYRVQAIIVGTSSESGWSDVVTGEKIPTAPAAIVNRTIDVMTLKDTIKLKWDVIASAIGYDIEISEFDENKKPVNPVVIDTLNKTQYIHDGLVSLKKFQYRIRSKTNEAESEWSEPVSIATLPDVPKTPENIKILTNGAIATLSWDAVEGPTKYQLLIKDSNDKEIYINLGAKNEYRHRRLGNGIEYSYRVRAYNLVGESTWSGEIVNNHLVARCERSKEIDLGLTASEVTDFDKYILKVFYNPGVLKIDDLCGYTKEAELSTGIISGTDIEITRFEEGEIVFKVHKNVKNGYSWTGIINNVKFTPKFSGGTPIGYVVEKLN